MILSSISSLKNIGIEESITKILTELFKESLTNEIIKKECTISLIGDV